MKKRFPEFFSCIFLYFFLVGICINPSNAQELLGSQTDASGLFDRFEEDRFTDITDQELMRKAFLKKKQQYDSLLTKQTPIFFTADHQELLEDKKLYILDGNVEIKKDNFLLKADHVEIDQWEGQLTAKGHVEIRLDKDILTGDKAFYSFDTNTGWITNARAAIEPSLFIEGDLLEKLPDFERTGEGQYALHDGFITACSGPTPDWRVKTKYAVVRIENYAHVNKSSFWISKIPIFYTPYWFFPTKSKRATGLLIPSLSWNSNRGFVLSEDFFWVLSETMDITLGLTNYSRVGLEERFEFRNAFNQYSTGEMRIEHIKERESPSESRNPQERWRGRYEQSLLFPADLRGTINLDFRSDQDFSADYGTSMEQEADRFMESRVSLTKYWNISFLTVDGTYEKDFNEVRDETIQHAPRIEYYSGWQTIVGILKGSLRVKAEALRRAGNAPVTFPTESGSMTVDDWLEHSGTRAFSHGELWLDFNQRAWFQFIPWVAVDESVWDLAKEYDPDHPDGTWATYPDELPPLENRATASIHESADLIRRHLISHGIEWTGPRFYRIYSLLGYKRVSKVKHLVEPKIKWDVMPEIDQTKIIEFDAEDHIQPKNMVTYSITNRILAKIKPAKKKRMKKNTSTFGTSQTQGEDDSEQESDPVGEEENEPSTENDDESNSFETDRDETGGTRKETGEIREFANFTISQSYDFYKADEWDERDPNLSKTEERQLHPLGNLMFDATVNPFYNIYFSSRIEYDPFFDSFSNGYIYGHMRFKTWKFGLRWDYTRNFENALYDLHSLGLEGGWIINDMWSFASWIKYDFHQQYFPYATLDLTYSSQCWALTLHTYYKNERTGLGIPSDPYVNSNEVQFGLSIKFKNLDSVGPRKFGHFWWGAQ